MEKLTKILITLLLCTNAFATSPRYIPADGVKTVGSTPGLTKFSPTDPIANACAQFDPTTAYLNSNSSCTAADLTSIGGLSTLPDNQILHMVSGIITTHSRSFVDSNVTRLGELVTSPPESAMVTIGGAYDTNLQIRATDARDNIVIYADGGVEPGIASIQTRIWKAGTTALDRTGHGYTSSGSERNIAAGLTFSEYKMHMGPWTMGQIYGVTADSALIGGIEHSRSSKIKIETAFKRALNTNMLYLGETTRIGINTASPEAQLDVQIKTYTVSASSAGSATIDYDGSGYANTNSTVHTYKVYPYVTIPDSGGTKIYGSVLTIVSAAPSGTSDNYYNVVVWNRVDPADGYRVTLLDGYGHTHSTACQDIVPNDLDNDTPTFTDNNSGWSGGAACTVTPTSVNSATQAGRFGGILQLLAGASTTYAEAGGSLFLSTAQQGNTAITETDLTSFSVPASTLNTNGDAFSYSYTGTFAATVNTKQLKVKFGATTVFDSGALAITSANSWTISGMCIRTGSATQKCSTYMNTSSGTLSAYASYATAAETLSGAVTLKLTGTAVGASDIVKEIARGDWLSAP